MRRMKKYAALFLAMVMIAGIAGCESKKEEAPKEEVEETTETEEQEEETDEEEVADEFTGEYVVNTDYVIEHMNSEDVILVDARGEEAAAEETVEGAIATTWQYLATCEDGVPGDANWGCILDTERLGQRLGELVLDKEKEIILFAASDEGWGDDGRIAWELLAAGYEDVKIVNGGFQGLKAAGAEMQQGASQPQPCEITVDAIDETHVINTDELQENYDSYKVVDVRADEEYNGEILYGEANGGHLPGAVHIRFTDLFQEDSTLKTNAELTQMFEDAGLSQDDQIVTYCTGGIRSAYMQLVMEMCGFEQVKNYDESFYRWAAVGELE